MATTPSPSLYLRITICEFTLWPRPLHSLSTADAYPRLSVLELGGPENHVYYVQHGSYAAQAQKLLGAAIIDANYPMDHTHTAPFLADVVRNCFIF